MNNQSLGHIQQYDLFNFREFIDCMWKLLSLRISLTTLVDIFEDWTLRTVLPGHTGQYWTSYRRYHSSPNRFGSNFGHAVLSEGCWVNHQCLSVKPNYGVAGSTQPSSQQGHEPKNLHQFFCLPVVLNYGVGFGFWKHQSSNLHGI